MKVNKGLGRGLSALFAETEEDYGNILDTVEKTDGSNAVLELDLEDVYPNPNQPRKVFDETALGELASSIEKHGVIMPIVVTKTGLRYMIIAGERRYRASKIAGKKTIPAVVKTYTEREIKEISLIENLQREDLNPIEAANAMKQLMDEFDLTQEELSSRIGKSRSAIANTLRLLTLSKEVIALISDNKLSAGHARALITLPQEEQDKLAKKAVSGGLSVRDVEKAVKEYFNPSEKKKQKKSLSIELKDMVERMQRAYGTKVSAIGNDNKGRIYIDYYTRDDLDRL
ncbi:MAG: ParB/RepB/Spo0J family partition protein [Clostridia bacterium]|nr:ParB/RepB/Spo0J family partition protein [Clostridia bacterium]